MTEFERQARERLHILAELRALADNNDAEYVHVRADELLVRYLRIIGADDIADAWDALPR